MPKNKDIKSVLIIGLVQLLCNTVIDYSGSQAIRSLKEEGIEVILMKLNPATIMTIHLWPICVFETFDNQVYYSNENPQIDTVLPTMGGQTALNCCIEAQDKGIWEDFNVDIIGVDIDAINITEEGSLEN